MTRTRVSHSLRLTERWRDVLDAEAYGSLLMSAHLSRSAVLYRRRIAQYAARHGLSGVDAVIMLLLRGLGGSPIRLSDIWKLYEYTPGAVTHRIGRLKKLEFVVTRQSAGDRRAVEVELTEAGRVAIESIVRRAAADAVRVFQALQLTPAQMAQFNSVIRDLEDLSEEAFSKAPSERFGGVPDAETAATVAPAKSKRTRIR